MKKRKISKILIFFIFCIISLKLIAIIGTVCVKGNIQIKKQLPFIKFDNELKLRGNPKI